MHIGTCKRCGTQREYRYLSHVKDYCSHACSNAAKWETRPRGAMATLSCAHCSGAFSMLESRLRSRESTGKKVKFCGKACEAEARRQPGSTAHKACASCGTQVTRRHTHLGPAFCSRKCMCMAARSPGSTWSGFGHDEEARRRYMRDYCRRHRRRLAQAKLAWAQRNRGIVNRIQRQRRAAGPVTARLRRAVFERYSHRCAGCGTRKGLEVDHIQAIARGGRSELDNLQVLCKLCNAKKGVLDVETWRARFRLQREEGADE